MDDLTKIKGIGAATAKRLVDAGIDSFAALAAFEISDPRFAALGVTEAQLTPWIEAARKLAPQDSSEAGPDASSDAPSPADQADAAGSPSEAGAGPSAPDAQPSGAAGTNNRPPKSDRKSGAGDPAGPAEARQDFEAKSVIVHDGRSVPAGKSVRLTRDQFVELKKAGAIDGDWKEG